MANDTPYGLAAGVHSSDAKQLRRVVRKLKAVSTCSYNTHVGIMNPGTLLTLGCRQRTQGTVWENTFVNSSIQAPFGGYKGSGWGRESVLKVSLCLHERGKRRKNKLWLIKKDSILLNRLGMQGMEAYLETKAVHSYYGEPLPWPM